MNRLLMVLILLVVAVLGVGFYLKWFHVSSDNAGAKSNITFTVDKAKMKEDENKAKEKMHDFGQSAKDKASPSSEKGKDPATAPVPSRPN
jgi:hypothetical protein